MNKMPNLSPNYNNNLLPSGTTDYTDDNAITSPLYNNLQYPYTILDTQQREQGTCEQVSMISNGFSPHLLLPMQHLNHNDDNIFSTVTDYSSDELNSSHPKGDTTSTSIYAFHNNPTIKVNELRPPERSIAGFVSKLYQSLQAPENGQKYARWCHHNDKDMFVIDCIPKFTEQVLPRLFKHCKFASFVRQLNIYGFQRDTDARKSKALKDKEICRWYHPYFRPGRRDLFHMIRRKATQNIRRKQMLSIEQDPETILTMDSGDDSEGDIEPGGNGSDSGSIKRRQSSASSASNLQHDSPLQPTPLELQPSYEILYHDNTTMGEPSAATLCLPPTVQSQVTTIDGNATMVDFSKPVESNLAPFSNKELQLQLQLRQLQTNYTNDHTFYTKQMQLAYSQIQQQKAHIKRLEEISSYQQYQLHSDRRLITSNLHEPVAIKKETYDMYHAATQLPNQHSFYRPHYADSISHPSFGKSSK